MGHVAILERLKQHHKLLITVNVLFAALAVTGQVGQNVTLPLWASAASSACNSNGDSNHSNGTHSNN